MTRRWMHWVPAAVVPALVGVSGLIGAATAGAAVDLPNKSPAQVLAMVADCTVNALSGTVEQSSALGLPALPAGVQTGASGAGATLDLLTGSHTARVYLDGPSNVRVQVLEQLAERDVVRHGSDVWTYDSSDGTVTHLSIPTGTAGGHVTVPGEVPTPADLADRFLTAIDPSTQISVGGDTRVAGRTAYDLVLTPRTSDTLIGSVSIAVDSETGLPLRVQVLARGAAKPAFSVGFTSLSLATPPAGLFDFTPPTGATVHQQTLPDRASGAGSPSSAGTVAGSTATAPTISGTGWSTVMRLPSGALPSATATSPLIGELTHAVPGGRALTTSLVSVLLAPDGTVLVGAVPIDRLEAVAAGR
ncbi:MAG TPA: sigma-E factor regulatory protein RseB domain-containing protein [Cellulomonadaceae bacterium]|nr:sigma-E factor regulatory protein RseB domain-containing protein [Cellulomonadaceae bacterium]